MAADMDMTPFSHLLFVDLALAPDSDAGPERLAEAADRFREHLPEGMVTLADPAVAIEVQLAGGAGYGAPGERACAAIAADLADGTITPEGAARDYGQGAAAAAVTRK